MNKQHQTNRRTVLKTLGAGVVGGVTLTDSVVADTSSGPIELKNLSFVPATYHTNPGTVTWKHVDEEFAGFAHTVHLHEHGNEGKRLKSSGALKFGDEYDVTFSLVDNGSTLRLTDDNQTTDVGVTGRDDIEFGVHCDVHAGAANIEETMKMDEFVVHL